jgi:hypothetical protein
LRLAKDGSKAGGVVQTFNEAWDNAVAVGGTQQSRFDTGLLQQVEGREQDVLADRLATQQVEHGEPCLLQATASPSSRHDRTLRWFTASTIAG